MLLSGHYAISGGLLKANEINHFLAEAYIPIFVQSREQTAGYDNGSGGADNMFWNRGHWNIRGASQAPNKLDGAVAQNVVE